MEAKNRKITKGIIFHLFFFLVLECVFLLLVKSEARAELVSSPKKGVAGGAVPETLDQLKVSWFYNWDPLPGYKSDSGYSNFDSKVWKKFVPLFAPWQTSSDSVSLESNIEKQMDSICRNTDYCGRGNYYLIGNEPDNPSLGTQDRLASDTTLESAALSAVIRYGRIMKAILRKDITARFIIIGFTYRNDVFVNYFLNKWKDYWKNDPVLLSLPDLIRGWHFHTYGNYFECPTDDGYIRGAVNYINYRMNIVFGKQVPSQEVWITEMGSLNDVPTSGTERSKFLNRMNCLINAYERSNIINRYAWFYHGCNEKVHSYNGCSAIKWAPYNLFYPPSGNCSSLFCITDLGLNYAKLGLVSITPTPVFTLTPTVWPTATIVPIPTVRTSTPFLTPLPTSLPRLLGDVNQDGCVNIVDYVVLILGCGKNYISCDFNGDEIVDFADYPFLIENYGKCF